MGRFKDSLKLLPYHMDKGVLAVGGLVCQSARFTALSFRSVLLHYFVCFTNTGFNWNDM